MQYKGSEIGINDEIIINNINYESRPGPGFTPGIGGTYKQSPPPFKPPVEEPAQFDVQEPSPGCLHTLSAGDDTVGFCSKKKITCELDRPYEPQRHLGTLRMPAAADPGNNDDNKLLKIIMATFLVYIILGRKLF